MPDDAPLLPEPAAPGEKYLTLRHLAEHAIGGVLFGHVCSSELRKALVAAALALAEKVLQAREAELAALRADLIAERKAKDLLLKGMESQAELMDGLKQDFRRLLAAIKDHHGQRADDRCIEDDAKLYAAAGLPAHDARVGDKEEMLANCARFIQNRCEAGGPWKSYRELEQERDALRALAGELAGIMAEVRHDCHLKTKEHFSFGPQRYYAAIDAALAHARELGVLPKEGGPAS